MPSRPSSASTRSTSPRSPEPGRVRAADAVVGDLDASDAVPSSDSKIRARSRSPARTSRRSRATRRRRSRPRPRSAAEAAPWARRSRPGPATRATSASSAGPSPRSVRTLGWRPRASSLSSSSASSAPRAAVTRICAASSAPSRASPPRAGARATSAASRCCAAVVEVALEPTARRVGRGRRSGARGSNLLLLALALAHVRAGDQDARDARLVEDRRRGPRDGPLAAVARDPPRLALGLRDAVRRACDRHPRRELVLARDDVEEGPAADLLELRPVASQKARFAPSGTTFASWSVMTMKLGIVFATVVAKSRWRCRSTSRRFRSVMSIPPAMIRTTFPLLVGERRGAPGDDAVLAPARSVKAFSYSAPPGTPARRRGIAGSSPRARVVDEDVPEVAPPPAGSGRRRSRSPPRPRG